MINETVTIKRQNRLDKTLWFQSYYIDEKHKLGIFDSEVFSFERQFEMYSKPYLNIYQSINGRLKSICKMNDGKFYEAHQFVKKRLIEMFAKMHKVPKNEITITFINN